MGVQEGSHDGIYQLGISSLKVNTMFAFNSEENCFHWCISPNSACLDFVLVTDASGILEH